MPPVNKYYFFLLIFIISIQIIFCRDFNSAKTVNVALFIFALLNLVPLQYVLSNNTFYKFALLKLLLTNKAHDKSALGILILFKFI